MDDILSIVKQCKVLRLAIQDDAAPYIVPLSFGYSLTGGALTLFFHSAPEGRKLELLRKACYASFEMDCSVVPVDNEEPCRCGLCYASVIGRGSVRFLEGEEKRSALSAIMLHQRGRSVVFTDEQVGGVCVFSLHVESVTGKARRP